MTRVWKLTWPEPVSGDTHFLPGYIRKYGLGEVFTFAKVLGDPSYCKRWFLEFKCVPHEFSTNHYRICEKTYSSKKMLTANSSSCSLV